MGILFSRFRKKKETYEILEDLESKIKEIEEYRQNTEQRHKKIVGRLIVYSVVLYIIAALVFYFYFFPAALYDQIFYMTPLLIFPILILFTKKLVSWYYTHKISRNQTKLSTMRQEKRKILDEVVETETYKKAKEILVKFAPDRLRMTPLSPQPTPQKIVTQSETPRQPGTPQVVATAAGGTTELRRRPMPVINLPVNKQIGRLLNAGPVPIGMASAYTPPRDNNGPSLTVRTFNTPTTSPSAPLPRPILSQQRSYLDRLVEYLVGDGPSNRYALICRQCESHNGMALKEEFEYFGFRCCYCNFWNPARKQKPSAPRLEIDNIASPLLSPNVNLNPQMPQPSEAASNPSDTDSDIEVVEKPETVDDSTEEKFTEEKKEDNTTEDSSSQKTPEVAADKEIQDDIQIEKMEVDNSP